MTNYTKYYVHIICWNIIVFFICPGPVIQTFLAECGISESNVFIINSTLSIFQFATLIVASPLIDKTKNVIKATALTMLCSIPIILFLLYSCYRQGIFSPTSFAVMGISFFLSQVGAGIYLCICYKLPYHIIDMTKYGRVSAFSGAIAFVATLILSSLLTYVQSITGYFPAISMMFIICLISVVIFVITTLSFKKINTCEDSIDKKAKNKINIFKYRPFYSMIMPNLFRGICVGATGAIVTIGYYCNMINSKSAGVLVILTSLMSFLGYIAYPLLEKKLNEGKIILIFSVINMMAMPFIFAFSSTSLLLVLYAISLFTSIVIGNAVPVGIAKVVDYEVMGQYSGYRMIIHVFATSGFGFVSMFLLNTLGVTLTMFLVALLQLISGILYFRFFKTESYKI